MNKKIKFELGLIIVFLAGLLALGIVWVQGNQTEEEMSDVADTDFSENEGADEEQEGEEAIYRAEKNKWGIGFTYPGNWYLSRSSKIQGVVLDEFDFFAVDDSNNRVHNVGVHMKAQRYPRINTLEEAVEKWSESEHIPNDSEQGERKIGLNKDIVAKELLDEMRIGPDERRIFIFTHEKDAFMISYTISSSPPDDEERVEKRKEVIDGVNKILSTIRFAEPEWKN